MKTLDLDWAEVADWLKRIPGFDPKKVQRFFDAERPDQTHFFKIRYRPGEVIMPEGAHSDFAAVHLQGAIRVLFGTKLASDELAKPGRDCWSKPGPTMRRLRNWVLDRTDRLKPAQSVEADGTPPQHSATWGEKIARFTAGALRRLPWFEPRLAEMELAVPEGSDHTMDHDSRDRLLQALRITIWRSPDEELPIVERFMGISSALWNLPRSVTLVADPDEAASGGPCTMLVIKRRVLIEIDQQSSEFRERNRQKFLVQVLPQLLPHNRIFRGTDALPPEIFSALPRYQPIHLRHVDKNSVISREGEPTDGLYLILNGMVRITRNLAGGPSLTAHHRQHGYFGVSCVVPGSLRSANAVAVTDVDLVHFGQAAVDQICHDYPVFREKLLSERDRLAARNEQADALRRRPPVEPPERLASKLMQATNLLLIDMDLCTRCDQCVRACADAHEGVPRFHRANPDLRLGKWEVAAACVHCINPPCQKACPVGAITYLESGAVQIHRSRCIGCAACVDACPFDVIEMLERTSPEEAPAAMKKYGFVVATKCDLCLTDKRDPPCVASCPYGAAQRGDPDVLFPGLQNWAEPTALS